MKMIFGLDYIISLLNYCFNFKLSVPSFEIPNFAAFEYLSDKLIHGFIYFYLAMLIFFSKFEISIIIVLIFIFGLFIEIIHHYHPYRYFELGDLLANFCWYFYVLFNY